MFNTSKSFTDDIKRYSWLLVLPLIVGLFLSSCGDSPINADTNFTDSSATNVNNEITFVPEQFDAVGTIQGTVIDKSTGEALSDVAVSLNFSPEGGEPSVLTDTTGSEGTFGFTGVPVNSSQTRENGNPYENSPYTLKISTEELDNYRDLYRYDAPLTFEGTGGDGAATNLVSDVTIPLSEQAVTLKGIAHTSVNDGAAVSGVRVELYQEDFNPIINGGPDTQGDMLVDSAETGEDGSFEFTGVEEKADVKLRFVDDSDPTNVINMEYTSIAETPAADGTTPEMDLGIIAVTGNNQSGGFYITSVTPEPGSDVETDTVFKYVFNRPVAENAYTRTDLGFGSGTIKDDIQFDFQGQKKSPGDVDFSASFSSDMKTLTVDPDEGALQDASHYELEMFRAFRDFVGDNGTIEDEFGNQLSWGPSDFDQNEVENLDFSTNDNNNAPHTPVVAVDSTSLNPDWDGGSLEMSWSVNDDSAEVKEYEIYISENGGAFTHMQTVNSDNAGFGEIDYQFLATNNPTFEFENSTQARRMLTDETSDPIDEAISYEVKVRAVSANLQEGEFSDTITFEDVVEPGLFNVTRGTGANDDKLYVQFSEPMQKSLVEDGGNYTINDGGGSAVDASITAEYDFRDQNNPDDGVNYDVILTIDDTQDLDDGVELEVSTDATDLAGNGMDTNNNTQAY